VLKAFNVCVTPASWRCRRAARLSALFVILLLPMKTAFAVTVAAFTYSPSTPVTGSPVSFDASKTACGSRCSYRWTDDADGSLLGMGIKMSFTFSQAGTKYVRLTVTDSQRRKSSVERDVIVTQKNTQPVAAFTFSPASPTVGSPVSFNVFCRTLFLQMDG
jgi:PKD domain-containing protein